LTKSVEREKRRRKEEHAEVRKLTLLVVLVVQDRRGPVGLDKKNTCMKRVDGNEEGVSN